MQRYESFSFLQVARKILFSRPAHPDLCRSLRSVPLSALRVQRYNFSHSPQALSQKFLKEISHHSDSQSKRNPPLHKTTLPKTQAETPLPSALALLPVIDSPRAGTPLPPNHHPGAATPTPLTTKEYNNQNKKLARRRKTNLENTSG